MLAAFAAAYMSTIGTQLNWGASYVINDFYRRFVKRDADERHYVIASQLVTVLLMIVSLIVTFYMESIGGAWKLLLVTGAGTGTVLLLRWFWWRINAWSEVSAMIAAAACSLFLQLYLKWDSDRPRDFAYLMLVTVGITTVVWLLATLLTQRGADGETGGVLSSGSTGRAGLEAGCCARGRQTRKRQRRTCDTICQLVSWMYVDLCISVWHWIFDLW